MIDRRTVLAALPAVAWGSRLRAEPVQQGVIRLDPAIDRIVPRDAAIETLARGLRWAEGPVWVAPGGFLLFTDPPANIMYRWSRARGAEPFLQPSGLQTAIPAGVREAGANGLALDRQGRLLIADSGTRAIVRLDLATRRRTVLADRFGGKRFNSPNDLAVSRSISPIRLMVSNWATPRRCARSR